MDKPTFTRVYILVEEESYTDDFKKIAKLIKKNIISSTLIIRVFGGTPKHYDILVDKEFIRVS